MAARGFHRGFLVRAWPYLLAWAAPVTLIALPMTAIRVVDEPDRRRPYVIAGAVAGIIPPIIGVLVGAWLTGDFRIGPHIRHRRYIDPYSVVFACTWLAIAGALAGAAVGVLYRAIGQTFDLIKDEAP
jgi:hypothetical protein